MGGARLLVLQQTDVLAILVGHASLLQFPRKVWICLGPLLQTLLLQFNASVDLIQTLLYLLGNSRRSRNVITCGPESILVGRVLHIDQSSLGGLVGVLAMLNQHPIWIGVEVLEETGFLMNDAIARLVFCLVASIVTLLLVVLDYGYPGAGLSVIFMTMMIWFVIAWYVVHILVLMLMVVLSLAGNGQQHKKYLKGQILA